MTYIVTDPVHDDSVYSEADEMTVALSIALRGMLSELGYDDLPSLLRNPDAWLNMQIHKDGDSYAAVRTISHGN